jgi:hypothetical protein
MRGGYAVGRYKTVSGICAVCGYMNVRGDAPRKMEEVGSTQVSEDCHGNV